MAGPALAARAILRWALRGTKQLSPEKRISKVTMLGKKTIGGKELRPWMKKVAVGDKSWLGSVGIGDVGRAKFVSGYTKSYKHLRKHKKLYAAGGAGAAVWDFLPGKDNPKA